MIEQRSTKRKSLDQVIHVRDTVADQHLGQIGNFSGEGLMLITKHKIQEDHTFQVEFDIQTDPSERKKIHIAIHCLWSLEANIPGTFWAGFEVVDSNNEDADLLKIFSNP